MENTPCSDSILLRYPYYPKQSTDSVLFPSKSQWYLFIEKNPKIHTKSQKILNNQSYFDPEILRNKNKVEVS